MTETLKIFNKIISLALLSDLSFGLAQTSVVQWDSGGCGGGPMPSIALFVGQKTTCDISVQYVPITSKIARADFTYELFYNDVVSGKTVEIRKSLPDKEWILAGGYSPQGLSMSHFIGGNGLGFVNMTFPTSINAKSALRYISLGVTANLLFTDGTKKKIYEKFPIIYR